MADIKWKSKDVKEFEDKIEAKLWEILYKDLDKKVTDALQRKIMKKISKALANGIRFELHATQDDREPTKVNIRLVPYFKGG